MLKVIIGTLVAAGVLVVIAVVIVVELGLVPANANARPTALERWAATTALHRAILREAPQGPDPLPVDDDNLIAGIKIYAANCVFCHGDANGKPSDLAKGFYQKPPQLAKEGVEDDPAGHTYWKVYHGIRWTAMPSFADVLSDQEVWQVTLFLKHMSSLPPAAEAAWEQVPSYSVGPEAPVGGEGGPVGGTPQDAPTPAAG